MSNDTYTWYVSTEGLMPSVEPGFVVTSGALVRAEQAVPDYIRSKVQLVAAVFSDPKRDP
jgi:hypothetical protein